MWHAGSAHRARIKVSYEAQRSKRTCWLSALVAVLLVQVAMLVVVVGQQCAVVHAPACQSAGRHAGGSGRVRMMTSCVLVAVLLMQIAVLVVGVKQQCAAVQAPAVLGAQGRLQQAPGTRGNMPRASKLPMSARSSVRGHQQEPDRTRGPCPPHSPPCPAGRGSRPPP